MPAQKNGDDKYIESQIGMTAHAKSTDETKSGILDDVKLVAEDYIIKRGPSYSNNFFFTIGVYLLLLFGILAVTGMVMALFGPYWWDVTPLGTFLRSIHLWAAEAFVTLLFVHLLVNFTTSAFKHRKLMWIVGSTMLLLVLFEYAFGVGLGGTLVAQANQQAGADLWNGMGLGFWINPMNSGAVYGWHIAIIPILLLTLMFLHYGVVRKKGLSTPYRNDIPYSMAPINHKIMYKRMVYILALVVIFALIFSAPYIPPLTISQAAIQHPDAVASTFLNESNMSSATATYFDTIDPYTFNTRAVYITEPYAIYINLTHSNNAEAQFMAENATLQKTMLSNAYAYFVANDSISAGINSSNPMIKMASQLTYMAQLGAYQPVLQGEVASGLNTTYVIRFLFDTGVLWDVASEYNLTVPQLGMLSVGAPPWSLQYWLMPYNEMENATGDIPWWNDIENGSIAAFAFLILILLPYIPGLRAIPDKFKLYKLFWNRYTIPEIRKNVHKSSVLSKVFKCSRRPKD
jgi:hypothetical protein